MRRGPHIGKLPLISCSNHLSSASLTTLCSGFRNPFILDTFCSNALKVLVLFFLILLIVERTSNSWNTSSPTRTRPIVYLSYYFKFSLDAVNFPFIRDLKHVITLPVSCSPQSRNVKGNTLLLGKLYWNRWLAMSLYSRWLLLHMSY